MIRPPLSATKRRPVAGAGSLLRTRSRAGGVRRALAAWAQRGTGRPPRWLVGVIVVASFTGLYLVGDLDPGTLDTTPLFALPIALCAIEFGVWGGLASGLLAVGLVSELVLTRPAANLSAIGGLSYGVAFLVLGWLLGISASARRALEERIARSEDLSLDLTATMDFAGCFKRVNRAWERTLDWNSETLCSRRFIEFVHPEDRDHANVELAEVIAGSDAVGFSNRYRARDGSYHRLAWNAQAVRGVIYASARDVTARAQADEANQRHGEALERTVRERTFELEQARLETLQRLAHAAEYRDDDTHQHTERVGCTAMLLARELGLSEETAQTLRYAAPLHDVGKLGIPDVILLKPGKLTPAESRAMQEHTRIGGAILARSNSLVLRMAEEIALTHHERWDGTGYPGRLAREEIPLMARITAVADVFDALTHKRPYKDGWPIDAALAEISLESGLHFDPAAVEAFLTLDHHALVLGGSYKPLVGELGGL